MTSFANWSSRVFSSWSSHMFNCFLSLSWSWWVVIVLQASSTIWTPTSNRVVFWCSPQIEFCAVKPLCQNDWITVPVIRAFTKRAMPSWIHYLCYWNTCQLHHTYPSLASCIDSSTAHIQMPPPFWDTLWYFKSHHFLQSSGFKFHITVYKVFHFRRTNSTVIYFITIVSPIIILRSIVRPVVSTSLCITPTD